MEREEGTAAAPDSEQLRYISEAHRSIVRLLITIVGKLNELITIGGALAMPEIVIPKAIVAIPPDPEVLAGAGQLRAEHGRMTIPIWRTALSCPAGVTTSLPLNIPQGWVTYRRKPLEVSSDFYDPNVGINVYSDGVLINPTAAMPLTGAFTVDMGEYASQWTQLIIEVINGTATDAVVTFQVCTYLFDASFWDDFVTPLIDAVLEKVEGIIK